MSHHKGKWQGDKSSFFTARTQAKLLPLHKGLQDGDDNFGDSHDSSPQRGDTPE
ncbi:Hypothetical predicted protein, partial [Pelobates cultripes]